MNNTRLFPLPIFSLVLLFMVFASGCITVEPKDTSPITVRDSSKSQDTRRVALGMTKAGVRENLGDPFRIEGGSEHMRWEYQFRVRCGFKRDCFYRDIETTLAFNDGILVQVYDAPGFLIVERRNVGFQN